MLNGQLLKDHCPTLADYSSVEFISKRKLRLDTVAAVFMLFPNVLLNINVCMLKCGMKQNQAIRHRIHPCTSTM